MGTTLVVNPGSSSRKYALYDGRQAIFEIRFEDTNTGFEMCSQISGTQQICESIKKSDYESAFARVADETKNHLQRELMGKK